MSKVSSLSLGKTFKELPNIDLAGISRELRRYWVALIVVIPGLVFTGLVQILRITLTTFAGKDTLKKAMLVLGTIVIFIGLIIQFVATF